MAQVIKFHFLEFSLLSLDVCVCIFIKIIVLLDAAIIVENVVYFCILRVSY